MSHWHTFAGAKVMVICQGQGRVFHNFFVLGHKYFKNILLYLSFQCTGTCDSAWQRRRVECRTHDGEPSDTCDVRKRPIDSRKCDKACRDQTTHQPGEIFCVFVQFQQYCI